MPHTTTPTQDLQKLIDKAAKAKPPVRRHRSKYSHLLPVAETLIESGFSLKDAVAWLVQERQVPVNRRDSAYSTLRQALAKKYAVRPIAPPMPEPPLTHRVAD